MDIKHIDPFHLCFDVNPDRVYGCNMHFLHLLRRLILRLARALNFFLTLMARVVIVVVIVISAL